MRYAPAILSLLLGTVLPAAPAAAQFSVTVSVPGVSIGIHQPSYPELVLVPGYPVYYAPQLRANYFFYDGLYWVYQDDRWYVSDWYNGPWDRVEPDDVPLFVLRVPVRYYLAPPRYFHGWYVDAPPRWHHHWGPRWTRHHHGWDHWDRHLVYAPAPLPLYQRHYTGGRYPQAEYRQVIRREHYHYQPRDREARRHFQAQQAARPQAHGQHSAQPRPEPARAVHEREPRAEAQRVFRERERERDQEQRAVSAPVINRQAAPVVPEQRQPQHREAERRAQAPFEAPQRPEVQREQRPQRDRGEPRRPEPQRDAAQPRQEPPRAQQAQIPRPQQAQPREAQERGERQSSRGNHERRQGSERNGDRERGQGRS